jgi:hypothetical protein
MTVSENIVAFDPGLSGGVAILSPSGEIIACDDLPTIGEGTQRRIDAANLASMIRLHLPARAVIEQVSAMPGQGVSSMFRFGQALGTIAGVVGALGLPVQWVSPAKWKREAGLDATAERSRGRAIETWPKQAVLFARKKDHNRAEAALLARWALDGFKTSIRESQAASVEVSARVYAENGEKASTGL